MSKLKNWVSHGIAIGIIGFVVLLVVSFFLLTDFAWMRVAGFTYSTVKSAVFFCIFYELLFLLVEIVAEGLKKRLWICCIYLSYGVKFSYMAAICAVRFALQYF